jgi:hypothetical protein
MKSILVALAMAGIPTAVMAQSGPTTYDCYVRDGSFRALQDTARPAWVRTADSTPCPVGGVCRSVEIDNEQ